MISPVNFGTIYLSARPLDFRKSFDGMCGEVRSFLQKNPMDRSLFIFFNRRHDGLKMLLWDNDGYIIWYKRLEAGTFEFPHKNAEGTQCEVTREELQLILSGVVLSTVKMRKRYTCNK